MHLVEQLADALVEAFNGAIPDLGATRQNTPKFKRETLPATATVVVVPKAETEEPLTQAFNVVTLKVDVGILQPLTGLANDQTSSPLAVLQSLKALWRNEGILRDDLLANCQFLAIDHDTFYDPESVYSKQQFFSVFTVTYQTEA